jgi:hypothetical protein
VLVPYFLLFLCFRKVTQEIFSELDKTKAEHPDIKRSFQKTEEETEMSQRLASPPGAWPRPWPCRPMVRPPWSTSDTAPSPIKTSRWEKPKYPINFPETHRDLPSSSTRDREGPEALPGMLCLLGSDEYWCYDWVDMLNIILCYLYVVYDLACSPLLVAILAE